MLQFALIKQVAASVGGEGRKGARLNTIDAFSLKNCVLQEQLPFVLRFGLIATYANLPVLLPLPWLKPLVMTHQSAEYAVAANVMQNYVLQLMLQAPHGQLKVILADTGLTDSFAALDQIRLKTSDKALEVAANPRDQVKMLQNLVELARERKTLLAQQNIEDWKSYLEQSSSRRIAPVLLVCLSNIRQVLLHEEAAHALVMLAEQGARLGIVLWCMLPHDWQHGLKGYEAERSAQAWTRLDAAAWHLALDAEQLYPDAGEYWAEMYQCLREFGIAVEVEQPSALQYAVEQIAARYTQTDTATGSDFIRIKIGELQTQPFYFSMGSASDVYHGLIAGATRTGKTSFLNQLVTQACEQYTPEQLQFFMFDFKEGVSFALFEQLAHVPVLHLDNEDHHALLHYLQLFAAEIAARSKQFKAAGRTISTIAAYNKQMKSLGQKPLPYWLLVVDEVQSLFEQDRGVTREIAQAIKELARKGGAFGLHMLFSTQTYRGVELDAGAKSQFGLRMGFRLQNSMDCRYLFDRDNDAPLDIPRYHAIYNALGGDAAANQLVTLDYIAEEEVDQRIEVLRQRYHYVSDPRFAYTKMNAAATSSDSSGKPQANGWM